MTNRELIVDRLWQMFSRDEIPEAMAILRGYRDKDWHHKELVQFCALRMSNGKLKRLRSYIQTAREDYRDLFLAARHPNEFRISVTLKFEEYKFELDQANAQDDAQFDAWLHGSGTLVCERCTGVGVIPMREPKAPDASSCVESPIWVRCHDCGGTGQDGKIVRRQN